MSTKTLVQNANDRKYSEFETNALEALKAKFMASPALQDSLARLSVAKGLTEAEFGKDDKDADDKDDKGSEEKDDDKGEEKDADDKDDKGSEEKDDKDKDED